MRTRTGWLVPATALVLALSLQGCKGGDIDAAAAKAQLDRYASATNSVRARAALVELSAKGTLAAQREFLAGKSTLALPPIDESEPEIAGDQRPGVTGGASCRPRGCRGARLICRPRGDNPCDADLSSIDVDCDTPC